VAADLTSRVPGAALGTEPVLSNRGSNREPGKSGLTPGALPTPSGAPPFCYSLVCYSLERRVELDRVMEFDADIRVRLAVNLHASLAERSIETVTKLAVIKKQERGSEFGASLLRFLSSS
jgi:hypothetical protein